MLCLQAWLSRSPESSRAGTVRAQPRWSPNPPYFMHPTPGFLCVGCGQCSRTWVGPQGSGPANTFLGADAKLGLQFLLLRSHSWEYTSSSPPLPPDVDLHLCLFLFRLGADYRGHFSSYIPKPLTLFPLLFPGSSQLLRVFFQLWPGFQELLAFPFVPCVGSHVLICPLKLPTYSLCPSL